MKASAEYYLDKLMETIGQSNMLRVARGKEVGSEFFYKFGRNSSISTTSTPEDIWNGGGIYTGMPDTAEPLEIFSSSANDTAAGTGARTVLISNLLNDQCVKLPDVTVTLNGTTPVSLGPAAYYRASRVKVLTAGSGGENAGTLTLRHQTTTANIFCVMEAGANQSSVAAYTVPFGYTLYVSWINIQLARANGSNGSANVTVRARQPGGVFQAVLNPEVTQGSPFNPTSREYLPFPQKTDIKFHCESVSDNNTILTAIMSGILIKN